ncbi:hypothetical protein BH09PAT4_BH09PAT4_05300 [soil metagenome]
MSFMNGKTKNVPQEHKAQLRMLPPDQIDRTRYPLKPTAQLSLDDRARLQYAQRSGKPHQPIKVTEPRPPKSDDEVLNNKFLVVLMIVLVPAMVLTLMWFVHMKPAQ